jgi:1-acyl-sn-glycerol-3-phosphate acyltransferase
MVWINKGVPLMAFPEGMRSKDGRLMEFKKGLFSMAVKANVPIIPITISHTNAIMPSYCILPIQPGRNKVHIHINEPISSTGKTEAELEQLVRSVFLNTLPECQLPLVVVEPAATQLASTSEPKPTKITPSITKESTNFIKIVDETYNKEIKVSP